MAGSEREHFRVDRGTRGADVSSNRDEDCELRARALVLGVQVRDDERQEEVRGMNPKSWSAKIWIIIVVVVVVAFALNWL